MVHRKRFADGNVCVPYRHFLGYDKGPDGNLAANQRCRFLLFQYTMTAQICKEKGEPAYAHGGVQNPCYRSIVSNTDTFEIRAADGEELLIHIGIDTVKLNGKFLKSCVKQEQPVKKGNLIEKMYDES